MPEIRASRIGGEYDPDGGNPVLVIRDEYGVLRAVAKFTRQLDSFVSGNLKGHGEVLVLEVEK